MRRFRDRWCSGSTRTSGGSGRKRACRRNTAPVACRAAVGTPSRTHPRSPVGRTSACTRSGKLRRPEPRCKPGPRPRNRDARRSVLPRMSSRRSARRLRHRSLHGRRRSCRRPSRRCRRRRRQPHPHLRGPYRSRRRMAGWAGYRGDRPRRPSSSRRLLAADRASMRPGTAESTWWWVRTPHSRLRRQWARSRRHRLSRRWPRRSGRNHRRPRGWSCHTQARPKRRRS